MSAPNELWPKPPASEVFRGLACKVVEVVDTEAAPISLLIHFFVAIGNIFGRGPYCKLGGSKHFCNLYAIVCGDSSKARKGTAWAQIREIIKSVDENWYSQCVIPLILARASTTRAFPINAFLLVTPSLRRH